MILILIETIWTSRMILSLISIIQLQIILIKTIWSWMMLILIEIIYSFYLLFAFVRRMAHTYLTWTSRAREWMSYGSILRRIRCWAPVGRIWSSKDLWLKNRRNLNPNPNDWNNLQLPRTSIRVDYDVKIDYFFVCDCSSFSLLWFLVGFFARK